MFLGNSSSLKMTMSVPERKSGSEGKEEESEDESEILEESPCGRWQKRKEQVSVCVSENRDLLTDHDRND